MNGQEIFKIGPVELTRKEAEEIYASGKYILTSTAVYQVFFSPAQNRFYGHRLYWKKGARFCLRGRYHVCDGAFINKIIGHELLA